MFAVFLSVLLALVGACFLLRRITPSCGRKLFRPNLEGLAERIVPALRTFLGGLGAGEWSIAANWQGGIPAGMGDDVRIVAGNNPSKADIVGLALNSLTVPVGFNNTLTL